MNNDSNPNKLKLADWTYKIPESEIRRLLLYNVPYYYGGGKPGILPLKVFAEILHKITKDHLDDISAGKELEVLEDYNYGPTGGQKFLREILADRLINVDKVPIDKNEGWNDVTITTGSQQALYAILDAYINPGDIIVTTRPAYLGFLGPAVKLGAQVVTVPTDVKGIEVNDLEKVFEMCKTEFGRSPKILYLVPDSDNPKGTTIPMERRKAIYDLALKWNFLILEDAAYKEMTFEGDRVLPIKSLDVDNSHVAYLGTTSKEACVLRLGYSVLPRNLQANVLKSKGYLDLCTTTLIQRMAAIYYKNYIDKVLPDSLKAYKLRKDAMEIAMDESFPAGERTHPVGGFFIWWQSEKQFDAAQFLQDVAIPNDTLYVPGAAFYPIEGKAFIPGNSEFQPNVVEKNTMRLSFSYKDEDNIAKGIRILGKLLKDHIG